MRVARSLSRRVSEFRKGLGLTQEQFARRARLDRLTVLRIENGQGTRNLDTLAKLSRLLGAPLDELAALQRKSS
jgi:putative transcriptional regulator